MTWQTLLYIIPLLLIEGLFSGSEIALLSCDRIRLQKLANQGSHGARLALWLIKNPEMIFATTLLMVSVCVVLISGILTLFFIAQGQHNAEIYTVLLSSPLIVFFGELLPKTIYRKFSEQIAPKISFVILVTFYLFIPITFILRYYTQRLSRFVTPLAAIGNGKKRTTRDEVQTLLDSGKKDSAISSSERRMIKRIFEFKDTEAKHTLIPLVKVDAIEDTANVQEALDVFKKHRHSRIPLYSGRIDNIIGIVNISDLLQVADPHLLATRYMRPAFYVAETQSLQDLLGEMKDESTEMAVVVDEYGGAVGVLTLEDIIEEIVGDIQDEYDSEKAPFKSLGPDEWSVEGRMEVKALNEAVPLALPSGDYETLAGFLLQQFGRIPNQGDELHFDTPSGSWRFIIREASERRIEKVLLTQTRQAYNKMDE